MSAASTGGARHPAQRASAIESRRCVGPPLKNPFGGECKGPASHQRDRIVAVHGLVVPGEILGSQRTNHGVRRHGKSPFILRGSGASNVVCAAGHILPLLGVRTPDELPLFRRWHTKNRTGRVPHGAARNVVFRGEFVGVRTTAVAARVGEPFPRRNRFSTQSRGLRATVCR